MKKKWKGSLLRNLWNLKVINNKINNRIIINYCSSSNKSRFINRGDRFKSKKILMNRN
jgi:hypothetical protein